MVGSTRSSSARTVPMSSSAAMNPPDTVLRDGDGDGDGERDNISRLNEGLESQHISNDNKAASPQRHQSEMDALGLHVKQAISTISQLEGLGLASQKIPLPRIVVLGEQSTGKSSVIESISGIQTPRATGTCTRCPLFIKLEEAPAPMKWTAHVTLRRSYHFDGKKGPGHRQFPGWIKLPDTQEVHFMKTEKEAELETMISRAQLATVSPLVDCQEFRKQDISHLDKSHRCSFSPNIVCIYISCVGLPALSFYDLPGIIGQSEEPDEVNFVRNLVTEYVKDPESLVLVTCSMENDIANSTAGGIARKLKATNRCIGVLTKPDRCHEISCAEVLRDVFETKRFAYGHGYFVVRNPDQEQLSQRLMRDEARFIEQQFFSQHGVFASKFANYSHRFGTGNLQAFLSRKLAEQITKKLPVIEEEMNARLLALEEEIKQYPEPPSHNAVRIVFDTVLHFTENVRLELEGDFPHNGWRIKWMALQNALFESFVSLKPTMATSGNRDVGLYKTSLGSATQAILVPDDDEEYRDSDNDVRMSDDEPETPTKKRKKEATPAAPSPLKNNTTTKLFRKEAITLPDVTQHKVKYHLDEVSQHVETTSNAKIPGRIEPKVVEAMMLEPLQHWQLPVEAFFSKLEEVLTLCLKELFDRYFTRWAGTALYSAAWKIVEDMLNANLHVQRITMAGDSLSDETVVHLFQKDIFNREKAVVLETYRQARFKARLNTYKKERIAKTGKPLTPGDLTKLLKDPNLTRLLHEEPYINEMDAVAEVSTYYMIAARRLHDAVCMRVQSKFFKQLRTQLRDEMEGSLGIHDEHQGRQNAIDLLTEDSEREQRRRMLVTQRHSLLQGQKILLELKQKKYGDDGGSQFSEETVDEGDAGGAFGRSTPQSEEMDEV